MSTRFQKKSIFLLSCVAATFVSVALFVFIYPRGTDNVPMSTEASSEAQSSESAAEWPFDDGGSDNETAEVGAMVQQTTEARAHTPEEMDRYINRMGRKYRDAQKYLSRADVPALLTMLGDPLHSQKWWDIETLLGYLIEGEEGVDALIAFIQRGEDWESLPHPRPHRAMLAKVDAISKLGFIGGDTATDALRVLLTEDGVNLFLSEWIDDTIDGSSVSRTLIRGKAASGLVYTQEAANIQLVEDLYQSVLSQVRVINQRPGTGSKYSKCETDEERLQLRMHSQAVTALAIRDLIESRGIEKWKSIVNDGEARSSALIGHFSKYIYDLKK